jgi:hypothetical protein
MKEKVLPLEVFRQLCADIAAIQSRPATGAPVESVATDSVVDITDQYVGKSLIFTAARLPEK